MTITVAVLAAAVANAQSPNAGATGRLTFSTTADYNSNPSLSPGGGGGRFGLSENLGFSFKTETSTQVLELFGSGSLSLSNSAGSGFSSTFTTPRATLRYTRDGANANFVIDSSYQSSDVGNTYLLDPLDPLSVIVDTGTLAVSSANINVNTGLNAPLGFSVNASLNNRDYVGTTNPALFDERTTSVGGTANLRLSPTTQAALSATRTNYVSGDSLGTRFEQMDYTVSVTHDLANAVSLSGNLGLSDKRNTVLGVTTQTLGLFGGVDVTRTLPDGSIFGGLKFDSTGGTPTTTSLTFGRSLDLPTGNLSASLSADYSVPRGVRFFGSAAYDRQLSDGSLKVNFDQSLYTDNFGQDVRYSNLGVAYNKTINSVSGVNLSMNVSRSEDAGAGAAPTQDRASLSASYNRALAPDWNLSVGYTRQQIGGATSAASDSLFLTITKDLQFAF